MADLSNEYWQMCGMLRTKSQRLVSRHTTIHRWIHRDTDGDCKTKNNNTSNNAKQKRWEQNAAKSANSFERKPTLTSIHLVLSLDCSWGEIAFRLLMILFIFIIWSASSRLAIKNETKPTAHTHSIEINMLHKWLDRFVYLFIALFFLGSHQIVSVLSALQMFVVVRSLISICLVLFRTQFTLLIDE